MEVLRSDAGETESLAIANRRERLRLAVVSYTLVTPGDGGWLTFNRVGQIVDRLSERGWDVTLVSRIGEPKGFLTHRLASDVRVIALGPTQKRIGPWIEASYCIAGADAALIFMPSLLSAISAVLRGRRTVIYAGGAWSLRRDFPRWRALLEALAARRSGVAVVAGEAVHRFYARHAREAQLCMPLVDEEVVRRVNEATGVVEAPRSPLRALLVGAHLSPLKGTAELFDALEELPQVECRLVGQYWDGSVAAAVRERISKLDNVMECGYLDWPDLRDAYLWADILVLPSYTEGFPRVLYEAAAFGLAAIVTPVGGIPDRLRDGHDALFVPVGNPAALREALGRLASDGALARRLATNLRVTLAPSLPDEDSSIQFDRLLRQIATTGFLARLRRHQAGRGGDQPDESCAL